MSNKKNLLLLAGLTGAGKSTVLSHYDKGGISTFYTGDIIPATISDREKIKFGDSFENANDFISQVMREVAIRFPDEELVLIDSIRSLAELKCIRTLDGYNSYLVGLLCAYQTRRERLENRDGGDESMSFDRDMKELGLTQGSRFNTGALFGFADFYVDNSGSRENTCAQLNGILEQIGFSHLCEGVFASS